DRAQRLYRRYGFAGIGLRRGYYQPSGADALVMRHKIGKAGPARAARRWRPGGAAPQAPGRRADVRASGTTSRQRCPGAEDQPATAPSGAPPARPSEAPAREAENR